MTDKQVEENNFEFRTIKYILVGLVVIALVGLYFILQKNGALEVFSRLNEDKIGYGLLFLIGFLASFHCIGMCGGFVVSYTTVCNLERREKKIAPHVLYNLGRIISYTAVGGILGGVGSFFGVSPVFSGVLTLVAAAFMIALGLSLVKKINFIEILKSKVPTSVANFLFSQKYESKPRGPLIIGLLNGLMPCGPLQAVQFYALGTGSALTGALSMFFFALGTVFLMFSFGYFVSSISGEKVKKMMRVSGVVVILLGLFMVNRGLANFGWNLKNLLPRGQETVGSVNEEKPVGEYQTVRMNLTYRGYEPNVLYAKKGIPVRWVIDVKQLSGCTSTILMEKFGIKKNLRVGENIIEFTPTEAGEITFSCGMKMVWGKFIITNN